MTWVKLDDGFADHPKLLQAGPLAKALFVDGLCYSARHLTDGFLPENQVKMLLSTGYSKRIVAKLLDVGLWEKAENGYQIHDYLEYQPSSTQVSATRSARSEAGRRGGLVHRSKDEANDKQIASDLLEANRNPGPARPVPVPTNSSPEVEELVDGAQKNEYPDWFEPLVSLKGFRNIAHEGSITTIREGCEEAGVETATVVSSFAKYYRDGGRATNGWTDPVLALKRTLGIQIRKVREGSNGNAKSSKEDPIEKHRRAAADLATRRGGG